MRVANKKKVKAVRSQKEMLEGKINAALLSFLETMDWEVKIEEIILKPEKMTYYDTPTVSVKINALDFIFEPEE